MEIEELIKKYTDKAWYECNRGQSMAVAPLSRKKVGACIIGQIHNGDFQKTFVGFNIELSYSHVYHAEEVAMINAMLEHYKPMIVFVTSKSFEESVALCGDCRQKLIEANPDCYLVVFEPDGGIKLKGKITDFTQNMKTDAGKIDWENLDNN